jgi:hypothetical protein
MKLDFRVYVGPSWVGFNFGTFTFGQVWTPTGWTELTSNEGNLQIDLELMDNVTAYQWSMQLSGFNQEERALLVVGNTILVEDGDGLVVAAGIIDNVSHSSNYSRIDQWNITVVSIATKLASIEVKPLRVGDVDIAQSANVTASNSLSYYAKEAPNVDDSRAAQEDYEPGNAVDGDEETVWIGDTFTGRRLNSNELTYFDKLGIKNYPMIHNGSFFIELINQFQPSQNMLYHYNGVNLTWNTTEGDFLADYENDTENGYYLGHDNQWNILFVQNAEAFNDLYRFQNAKHFIDAATESSDQNREFFDNFSPVKGVVAMVRTSGFGRQVVDWIAWGAWDETSWEAMQDTSNYGTSEKFFPHWDDLGPIGGDGLTANGTKIFPSLEFNQIIRKKLDVVPTSYDPNEPYYHAQEWEYESSTIQSPGQFIRPYDLENDGVTIEAARDDWILLTMPTMEHYLLEDVGPGDSVITLVNEDGYPNVDGLPSSGRVFVDTEILTYSAKDYDTGELTLSSAILYDHNVGSKVLIEEGTSTGYFTDAWPIAITGWERNEYPVPRTFVYRWSYDKNAKSPSTSEHERTWNTVLQRTNFTALTDAVGHSPILRPRKIVIEIGEMGDASSFLNETRARLNTLYALVDKSQFDSRYWIDSNSNEYIIQNIAYLAGLPVPPATMVTLGTEGPDRLEGTTDFGQAWSIMTDLAEYGNSFIEVDLDSTIVCRENDFYTAPNFTVDHALTEEDVISLRVEMVRPGEIGQFELTWESFDGTDGGVVHYPATRVGNYPVKKQGPQLYESETDAQIACERLYKLNRYPHNIFIELADTDLEGRPGDIDTLYWNGVTYTMLASAYSYAVEDGKLRVTVNYRELERA